MNIDYMKATLTMAKIIKRLNLLVDLVMLI